MSSSREIASHAIAAQLASTQSLIQQLLGEIRQGSADQAALKQELKSLRYNVTTLSNIIRGGDGHSRPLLSEVEILKHADNHLEKRLTKISKELEDQIGDVNLALIKQINDIRDLLKESEKKRQQDETARIQLIHDEHKDLRLDKRQRFATWSTIIIAVISFIASLVAIFGHQGG